MAPRSNEQHSPQQSCSSYDDVYSVRGNHGSGRSEKSIPGNAAQEIPSPASERTHPGSLTDARLMALRVDPDRSSSMLDRFLKDPVTGTPFPASFSSTEGTIRRMTHYIGKLLHEVDLIHTKDDEKMWSPPSPIDVYPLRVRLPGELHLYRLADGVSATQPLRGLQDTQTNSTPTHSESGNDPAEVPSREKGKSKGGNSKGGNSRGGNSKGGKSKGQKWKSLPALEMQKTTHSSSEVFMNPSYGAPAPVASYQQVDQAPQRPPDNLGISYSSLILDQSSVLLPNNVVWQPDQSLFAEEAERYPSYTTLSGIQNHDASTEHSNSSPPFHLYTSTCNTPSETMQSLTSYNLQADPPQQYSLPAIAKESFYDPTSRNLSLESGSSSSQTRYSTRNASSNHSPAIPHDVLVIVDNSPNHPTPPETIYSRQHGPEMLRSEPDHDGEVVEGDGKMSNQDNDWETWVNYSP